MNFNAGQVDLKLKKLWSFAEEFPRLQFPARDPRGGVLLASFGAAKSAPRVHIPTVTIILVRLPKLELDWQRRTGPSQQLPMGALVVFRWVE